MTEFDSIKEGEDKYWELDSSLSKLRIRIENIHEHYKELIDFTNINLLKNKIQSEIVSNYKKLLIDDIAGTYELCRDEIRDTMRKIKLVQEDIIKTSQGDLEEIKRKQEEYTKKYQEAEADKRELERSLSKLRNVTKKRADDLERAIKNLGGK